MAREPPPRAGRAPGTRPTAASWADFVKEWGTVAAAAAANAADAGAGLAVLAAGSSSPTLARLAAAFRQRYPRARWVSWEPVHDEAAFRGVELATGQALRPVYHLERAKVVVALDADLLLTESGGLAHARGFAEARHGGTRPKDGGGMNRLYAVESTLSITGAAADHRLRLPSGQIGAFALALAAELGLPGAGGGPELPEAARARLGAIAADLRAARGSALVVAGRHQPAEVHAVVFAINAALGAVAASADTGGPLTLHPLTDVGRGGEAELTGLTTAMQSGEVQTLVVLGGNPVYTAPADLDFAAAFAKVPRTVHLSSHVDETSRAAVWHLPETHFLEQWGDVRSADGTLSAIQPLIAPLFDGAKSAIEVAGLLAGGTDRPGYDLVRETWQGGLLAGADSETAWRQALHDGVVAGSALPVVEAAADPSRVVAAAQRLAGAASPSGDSPDGLELTFPVSRAVYDGRFANVAWLQELPDPLTKIVWDNAALVSPATAEDLKVASGDVVRLTYRGRSVEAPVWVLAGQADGSIALPLGYGRTAAGRVGDGVGVDAYRLRTADAPGFGRGLAVEPTGRTHALVQTQEHWQMEGRELVREATLAEFREHPEFAKEPDAELRLESLWKERAYDSGHQWGMAIDLNACIGCNACVIACQAENNIPVVGKAQVAKNREMQWLRVDRYFSGVPADPEVSFQPMPCQHCENAPCEEVCPVAATVHDREGINAMVYNRCIGTRYCSNNCPYKVRRFNFFNYTKDTPELVKLGMNPDVTVRSRGVMEKCTYCIQRINEGKIAAKRAERPLADGEIKTACQQTCPTQAIVFGDLRDAASQVVARKREPRDYTLLAALNNKPRTSYQAKLRNPNPAWGEA